MHFRAPCPVLLFLFSYFLSLIFLFLTHLTCTFNITKTTDDSQWNIKNIFKVRKPAKEMNFSVEISKKSCESTAHVLNLTLSICINDYCRILLGSWYWVLGSESLVVVLLSYLLSLISYLWVLSAEFGVLGRCSSLLSLLSYLLSLTCGCWVLGSESLVVVLLSYLFSLISYLLPLISYLLSLAYTVLRNASSLAEKCL